MRCPGCGGAMEVRRLSTAGSTERLEVDVCLACHGLWFDGEESAELSPRGTLALFRALARRHAVVAPVGAAGRGCPRCGEPLVAHAEEVRGLEVVSDRCAAHGSFQRFAHFLREKRLVKRPSADALAALSKHTASLPCLDCGGRVPLPGARACPGCRAPLLVASADALEAAIRTGEAKARRAPEAEASPARVQVEARASGARFSDWVDVLLTPATSIEGLALEGILELIFSDD